MAIRPCHRKTRQRRCRKTRGPHHGTWVQHMFRAAGDMHEALQHMHANRTEEKWFFRRICERKSEGDVLKKHNKDCVRK